jgi:hypothetical protein
MITIILNDLLGHQCFRHYERKLSNPRRRRVDCFVARAPLRNRFAFVAGNDGNYARLVRIRSANRLNR